MKRAARIGGAVFAATLASVARAAPPPDVVEKIDLSGTSAPAPAPAPVPTPETKETFRFRGFARARFSAAVAGEGFLVAEPPSLRVPWEPIELQPQLFAEARYARGKAFEATASGVLDYQLYERIVFDTATGNARTTSRGEYDATLRELYVGTTIDRVGVRVGQQRIAWGNSDAFPINDVLDPRDMRDPVLIETELRYLPMAAARVDVGLGDAVSLQLVGQPFFVSDRFDVYGTPWALVQPTAPAGLRSLYGRLNAMVDPSLDAQLSPVMRQTRLPYDDLSGGSAGAKLAYTGEGFDAAAAYEYGLSYQPALAVDPTLARQIATTDWSRATPQDLVPIFDAVASGRFASTYPRRHHAGAWAAKVLSPFLVRGEVAYDSASVFLTPSLFGVVRPTVQGVAGIEWQSGEIGKTIVLEGWARHVLGDDPGALLGANVDSGGAATVVRWTFAERLEIELRTIAGFHPLGVMARPQIAYKSGGWQLRAGVAWLDGEDGSLPRYYRRNTSAYLIAKASF